MKSLHHYLLSAAVASLSLTGNMTGFSPLGGSLAQAAEPTTVQRHPAIESLSSAFREIGKNVEPSVVSIQVRKEMKMPPGMRQRMPSPFNDPRLRPFFDPNGDGDGELPSQPDQDGPSPEQQGTGSGFIIEVSGNTGYVVTNNHLAGNATEIEITMSDGRIIKNGKIVGVDPKTDLALIKIESDDLKPMKWGDSKLLQKGDWVLAFGSPLEFVGSMTHGIVSALHRSNLRIIPQGYENFIQVDAPINPGNSGGPLVNTAGEVIGINTAIASRTGGFQGIGFAIASETARPIIETLKTKGKVTRGWLGVSIASVNLPAVKKLAESLGYKSNTGVFVQEVIENTPASAALRHDDIIVKMDGNEMIDADALRGRIATLAPGTEVSMTIFRAGKEMDVKIKLGDQPDDPSAVNQPGGPKDEKGLQGQTPEALGMRLAPAAPEILRRLGLPDDARGALVNAVAPRSLAAKAGIHPGDLITEVNGKIVTTAEETHTAINSGDLKKGVRLYVRSRNTQRSILLQSDAAKEK